MRIGWVVTGGVDRSGVRRVTPALVALIERLARRHDVHVFVLHHEPRPADYALVGATVHDLGRVDGPPGLRRWRERRRLSAALRAHPVDVLHGYQGVPAAAAVAAGPRAGVPVVVTFDSGEFVSLPDIAYGLQRRWPDRMAIRAAARGAAAVTVTTRFQQRLAAFHGIDAQVIAMGTPRVDAAPARPADGPPWRLLHVGSVNLVKDHDTLIAAVAQVVADGVDVSLDVIGEDTRDGAVARRVASLGLGGRVRFLGWQPAEVVAAHWAGVHLHVVSSRHEAGSVATLEAGMHGVPTVGTAVGHVADGAPHRAVAVPPRDPAALAAAIRAVLADPDRRAALAEQACMWSRAHDADSTAAAFDALYSAVARAKT